MFYCRDAKPTLLDYRRKYNVILEKGSFHLILARNCVVR